MEAEDLIGSGKGGAAAYFFSRNAKGGFATDAERGPVLRGKRPRCQSAATALLPTLSSFAFSRPANRTFLCAPTGSCGVRLWFLKKILASRGIILLTSTLKVVRIQFGFEEVASYCLLVADGHVLYVFVRCGSAVPIGLGAGGRFGGLDVRSVNRSPACRVSASRHGPCACQIIALDTLDRIGRAGCR